MMADQTESDIQQTKYSQSNRIAEWRFIFLLSAMVSIFIFEPFLAHDRGTSLLLDFLEAVLLVASVNLFSGRSRRASVALGMGLVAFCAILVDSVVDSRVLDFARLTSQVILLLYTFSLVASELLSELRVDLDHILAAASGYFLIGLASTAVFQLIEKFHPGSFLSRATLSSESELLYFSFSTLTTVGYGDIVPAHTLARTASLVEAIVGQMYLAFIVARIVGLHTSHLFSRAGDDEESKEDK